MSAAAEASRPGWVRPALIAGLLALLLGTMAAFAVRGSRAAVAGPYGQFAAEAASGELGSGSQAGQTFVADQPGLYRIDLSLENSQPQSAGPLKLHVKAAPDAENDLALVTLDSPRPDAAGLVSFSFAPLAEQAGQPLYFWLEAPAASPGGSVKVMGTAYDSYPGGAARFDQPGAAGGVQDLAFRLYYRPGAGQAIEALTARLASGRPAVFGAPWLYPALVAAYALGLAGLLVLLIARLRL
jgi:hypothetical protein